MYSKIHSRLDWFFSYIGEPEDEFEVELYGDVNFDGNLNVTDVITLINFVLGQTPTEEESLTGDMNQDGILNILDVIQLVGEILGTTFAESVEWLEENFPALNTKERLQALDKSQFFAKKSCCSKKPKEMSCVQLQKEFDVLIKQYEQLEKKYRLLEKLDADKMKLIKQLSEKNNGKTG